MYKSFKVRSGNITLNHQKRTKRIKKKKIYNHIGLTYYSANSNYLKKIKPT